MSKQTQKPSVFTALSFEDLQLVRGGDVKALDANPYI